MAEPTTAPIDVERAVFLLQYIAVDYGAAVADGAIENPFEYQEMLSFSELLVDGSDDLHRSGASEQVLRGIRQLRARIGGLRPWSEVRELANDLAGKLVTSLDVVPLPTEPPDLEHGRSAYAQKCASCHGPTGGGDGPAARGMEPPPTAFDEARMSLVSPHHLYGAIRFGIEGTAMPSYVRELESAAIWNLAFFVATLRSGFAPRPPPRELPLTLSDLARYSNEELLARVRSEGVAVDSANIDHYRASPGSVPRALRPPEIARPDRSAEPARSATVSGAALNVALSLQDAFAGVAEQTAPSVVGLTGLVRRSDEDPPSEGGAGTWRGGSEEERLYPGFGPARSGSGFLVSEDGYILTAHHLLTDAAGELVEIVDVELHEGRHVMARIVGTEPTINLGILQLEHLPGTDLPELWAVRIGGSEGFRVGHWAIALGNPAGPGTSFSVGTLSSGPERQCYQEELTATLMQTALAVPTGGYGGPLTNIEGEVVGIMVPGPGVERPELAPSTGSLEFALPIDLAMAIYEPLTLRESRRSPWLGFSVLELRQARLRQARSREAREPTQAGAVLRRRSSPRSGIKVPRIGVYIDDVYEPSPAAAAGVRIGDRLISIDGNRLVSVSAFQRWLYLSGIGRTITLEIFRDGQVLEKQVTVAERPDAARPR